ncbi:MAG: ABC transporter substrate-binding protein [Chloroflexota bacterium]|nr:ABC transporter substrate-binding protein [Chloroflexota bacterium]
MRRVVVLLTGIVILALLLGACGGSQATPEPTQPPPEPTEAPTQPPENPAEEPTEEPTEEPPEVSGPLTVLAGPQEDWAQAMVAAFEQATGIETSYVRLSSGEAFSRLQAEAGAPSFDVWWGGPNEGQSAAYAEGLIEPYVPPNAAQIPDGLKHPDGVWTGIYVGALGFCSNQDLLDELGVDPPTSWDDLLAPALEGNIAVADARTSGTAYTFLYSLVALRGEEEAFEYLKQVNENIFQYTKSGSAPGRMAAAGEVAVAIIFSHDCVKFREETGANLVVSFPAEGTGFEIGSQALIKNAPNPEAAKVWMEWALSPEAQAVAPTVRSYQVPSNPNTPVPPEAIALDQVNLLDYDHGLAGELRAELSERFGEEVREGAAPPEG